MGDIIYCKHSAEDKTEKKWQSLRHSGSVLKQCYVIKEFIVNILLNLRTLPSF